MNASTVERIRLEAERRLGAEKIESSDVGVRLEAGTVVLEGSVDDAFAKSIVEGVAREIAGDGRVRSTISVRDDLGAEGGPKVTEFGTARVARGSTSSIPRPMD
jgi:osmotically-inducible protein OsmY